MFVLFLSWFTGCHGLDCALVYGNRPERACAELAWFRNISVVFGKERLVGLARCLVACPCRNHARAISDSGLLRSSVGRLCGLVRGSLGLAGQFTYVIVQDRREACMQAYMVGADTALAGIFAAWVVTGQ